MSKHSRALPVVLGTLTAFAPLSIDMYLPALPSLQRDLHTTASAAQLSLAAYFAGLGLTQLFYGPLADRFGRKRPLYGGIALYIVASLGCAMAPDIRLLIALRFLQAMGGAAGPVIARAVVRDLYRGREAAQLMALLMLVMGAAPILAPLAGGALLATIGWRSIFVALAAIGIAALALSIATLPETGKNLTPKLELRGLATSLKAIVSERGFLAYALAGGFTSAGMFAYISGSPFVFIELHHVPATRFGWYFGANAFGLILGSQVNHRLLLRFSPAQLLTGALVVTNLAGFVLVFHSVTGVGGLPLLAASLFAFVGSLGFISPNAAALALEEHGTRAGLASAALGSGQFVIATIASTFVSTFNDGSARPMAFVMCGCALLSAATLRTLRGETRASAG
jgi:DHA1 family bicyclomycin/chloramphenicol resistance-like MFS transporter